MRTDKEKLKDKMSKLKDEILLDIVNVNFNDYEPEAIDIAKQILEERGINYLDYNKPCDDKETTQTNNDDEDSIPIYYEMKQSSGGYQSVYDYRDKYIEKRRKLSSTVRPLTRFWARAIDLYLWAVIVREIIKLISTKTYVFLSLTPFSYILRFGTYITWMLVEACLLSLFGYTVGKFLLRVKVRDFNGNKLGFKRAFRRVSYVLFYGEALYIPFINLIANINAYYTLKNSEMTSWDEKLNTNVTHNKVGVIRTIIAIGILIYPLVIHIISLY